MPRVLGYWEESFFDTKIVRKARLSRMGKSTGSHRRDTYMESEKDQEAKRGIRWPHSHFHQSHQVT